MPDHINREREIERIAAGLVLGGLPLYVAVIKAREIFRKRERRKRELLKR
jgi:hypothetical protein